MRTSWFTVGGLMAAAAVGLAMASAPAPTVPPAPASTRGDSSAAAAYAAQLGLTAAVGLPYKAITFAIHQFSYLVWVSKLQLFNAVSVAFQTAVGITLPLVATAVVNGVIKGVEKKISGEDMGKMAKIVEKVLKKFEENRPGLFPAGVDFAALAKKVVEESVPKPAKKGGKPAPARPKASLDDYSPELRAMLGFDPEEEAAARALIAKEVMREAETAAMKDSSSGQRAMFLPTEQLGLVKGGDRRRSQVQGILDLIDAVMIQELVGQVYGSRPRPSYAPPPPAYAPPPTSSTYAPSTYAPPPPSSTYAPPPNSTYEVPSSTYAPPPSTYAPPPPPSTYAPPPQPAYAPPPPPPAYAIQGAAAPVATRQACGRDFSFGGKSYLFSWASGGGARADWASARAACRACGMDLVSLESAAENEAVKAMIDAAWRQGVIQYSWTGGQRTGGGWSWVSGQPIALPGQGFHNWGIDQPDNVERNEDCIAFLNPTVHNDPSGQMTWNDVACYYQKPYVCEG